VIVFEHDFGIWKLDVASKKATSITLNIDAETQDNMTRWSRSVLKLTTMILRRRQDELRFQSTGKSSLHRLREGDLKQITDGPARERSVNYSPDGKWLAYVSDQSGRKSCTSYRLMVPALLNRLQISTP
jgi:tricorn protease